MKSKAIDKITVTFYEETMMDKDLLDMLNRYGQHNCRPTKIKEWAYLYLKEHLADELKELSEDIKKEETKEASQENELIEKKLNDDKFWKELI